MIRNIDGIYLINLEQRPEKREKSLGELARFSIQPKLVSAVYGWTLTRDTIEQAACKMQPGMEYIMNKTVRALTAPITYPDIKRIETFKEWNIGAPCFHTRTTLGAFGCALSHLFVLQHAWHAHHRVIWVLEDDFTILKDPHVLGELVEILTGEEKDWDLFYTDDKHFLTQPFSPDIVWRPDRPAVHLQPILRRAVGTDFFQISGRNQARSMILSRFGIEKILSFARQNGLFLPYDLELAFIPNLNMYNVRQEVVRGSDISTNDSDVLYQHFE